MRQVGYTNGLFGLLRQILALLAIGLFVTACGSDSDSTEASAAPPPESQAEIIELTNIARAQGRYCGDNWFPAAGPVVWNENLRVAAARHSQDMHENEFFAHEGSDSTTVGDRASDAGYNWSIVGENLSMNAIPYSQAIQGWIESTSHCEALMNNSFVELGVERRGVFWTMVLGIEF